MALTTGGFTTFDAIGNREDLSDEIYRIDREETPIVTAVGRSTATAVLHEWQTDALAAVDTSNAVLEGGDVTPATSAPTVRLQNYVQTSQKSWAISRIQRRIDTAGREDEYDYQRFKRGLELRRDIEAIIAGNQGYVAGDTTTARKTRSIESFLTSNTNRGSGGADATAATAAATDATTGDRRAFTEAHLKAVLKSMYDNGGMRKNGIKVWVGSFNKQAVSDFTGRASARQNIAQTRIQAAAELYASDFGTVEVIPNVHQRSRTAIAGDPEYAALAYIDGISSYDLAKIGDSDRGFMIADYALEMKNEKAWGCVADLTDA